MIVKLLTEHHLEFLGLKGSCRGSSESTHVKIAHCWKSQELVHIIYSLDPVCPTFISVKPNFEFSRFYCSIYRS